MPKNRRYSDNELKNLQALGFVNVKQHLLEQAKASGERLSGRKAKAIAGAIMSCVSSDDYKRIVYRDEVGEEVAHRRSAVRNRKTTSSHTALAA